MLTIDLGIVNRADRAMPHIVIEYSGNLDERADLPRLLDDVHAAALDTGVFPVGGTRTRAARRDLYRIADGHPDNAFVHASLAIGAGRDAATKARAAQAVFDAICAHFAGLQETMPLALSLEMREIDPDLSFKRNTIHDHVKRRQTEGAQ